jgi:ribosomal protein L16 Arg81 hydroxylase
MGRFTPWSPHRGIIHADGYDNLNAQIRGRKEWILLAPDQLGRSHGAESDSTIKKSDIAEHRELAEEEGFSCTTNDGEILYIPKLWWHAATALESCININAWHMPDDHPIVLPGAER